MSEHLPSMYKTLDSIVSTEEKRERARETTQPRRIKALGSSSLETHVKSPEPVKRWEENQLHRAVPMELFSDLHTAVPCKSQNRKG